MTPTLYVSPGACATASHVALQEAGIPHEIRIVNLRAGEQRTPGYLAVNPAGVTPALETVRGVITQNAAILEEVQVDGAGFIFIPYAGRIRAAGSYEDLLAGSPSFAALVRGESAAERF